MVWKILRSVPCYKKQLRRFCSNTEAPASSNEIRRLLDASLQHLPSKGWTVDALELGARDLNYPPVVHGLFENPAASLLHHFMAQSNGRLVEYIKEEDSRRSSDTNIGSTLFVADAVKHRLQMNIPYAAHLADALSIATHPAQVQKSILLLLRMCDDIWYYSGDRSTDMSWYTKRTSLAAVYTATELYMVQDRSVDYEDTWLFMWRRFEDLKTIGQPTQQITSMMNTVVGVAYSAYVVGRNAIGANVQSRK